MNLAALFPDQDYRFHMRMERGKPEDFFAPTASHLELVAERVRWLHASPETYAACRPDAGPLLAETIQLLQRWKVLSGQDDGLAKASSALELCTVLGEILEPDFLFLKPNAQGEFELRGGCVCFPSSWSLAEKIGRPLDFIHAVVPGLNSQMGNSIETFLNKLPPGIAWLRHNWGLARSPELNQHPQRHLPRLEANVRAEEVWLRVEHQALIALPESRGVLFAIRIAVHPLSSVKQNESAARNLRRALVTMPEEMAAYKNIARVRHTIVDFLAC